jgi:hypothetical protein
LEGACRGFGGVDRQIDLELVGTKELAEGGVTQRYLRM